MNKFDKLYDLIIEDIKNPKLRVHAKNDYRPDGWDETDDEYREVEGACGSVIKINKTYEKWLANNVEKSYKKYDFDKNQTYEPVLTQFDNDIKTKSYTGAELEDIKNEYKGTTVHELELSIWRFIDYPDKTKAIYERQYEFKDLITIDEENFYLDKWNNEGHWFWRNTTIGAPALYEQFKLTKGQVLVICSNLNLLAYFHSNVLIFESTTDAIKFTDYLIETYIIKAGGIIHGRRSKASVRCGRIEHKARIGS